MFKGIIPVIPTPFSDDGERVLYDQFAKVVDLAIREGANSIMLFGAGGEFYKLTEAEKQGLLVEALQVCSGRAGVAVTVTSHATRQAVREAEAYQKLGAGLVNIMPPSFAAPTGAMVMEHIVGVARAVSVPVMIQYAPALTGSGISNEVFAQIADRIQGELYIKVEAIPTGPAITAVIEATRGRCNVVIGNGGECLYEAWERGAVSVMPGASLVKPYHDIITAFESGDREMAWNMYRAFLPYLHFIHRHIEEFVYMEKTILMERGILSTNTCRKPAMSPDQVSLQILMRAYHCVQEYFYD